MLIQQWNQIARKRSLIIERQRDVVVLKRDLNSDNWWTLSTIPDIAVAVKTAADLVSGLLSTIAPSGSATSAALQLGSSRDLRARVASAVYDGLGKGKEAYQLSNEQFSELAWSLLAESTGRIGTTLDLLRTTAENIETMRGLSENKSELRAILEEQTSRLDRELSQLASRFDEISVRQDALNGVRDAIDRFCAQAVPTQPAKIADRTPPSEMNAQEAPLLKTSPDLEAIYRLCTNSGPGAGNQEVANAQVACVDRELSKYK